MNINEVAEDKVAARDRLVVNIKGCNGSGKSTIPLMLQGQFDYTHIVSKIQRKPIATLFEQLGYVFLGSYITKCGGCDTFKCMDDVKWVLDLLWETPYHIVFEGVIVGDIKSTFFDFLRSKPTRHPAFAFLTTPLDVCLQRIYERNKGNPIKEDLVKSKWNNMHKHLDYYKSEGAVVWENDNVGLPLDTLAWFVSSMVDTGKLYCSSGNTEEELKLHERLRRRLHLQSNRSV